MSGYLDRAGTFATEYSYIRNSTTCSGPLMPGSLMWHDELVFEVMLDDADEAAEIIRDEMEAAGRDYLSYVSVVVEVNAGEAWEK